MESAQKIAEITVRMSAICATFQVFLDVLSSIPIAFRIGRRIAEFEGRLGYHANQGTSCMQIELTKKLFTVDEYYQMAETGIFGPADRVELIDGEVIQMSPIGDRHAGCVNRLNRLFAASFVGRAVVSVQNPLQLNNYTEPEPDLVLLKPRPDDYMSKKVQAEDALLVIEVSDTTLYYDRNVKVPRYAAAGIPEVWIENLEAAELLVYRGPADKAYAVSLTPSAWRLDLSSRVSEYHLQSRRIPGLIMEGMDVAFPAPRMRSTESCRPCPFMSAL